MHGGQQSLDHPDSSITVAMVMRIDQRLVNYPEIRLLPPALRRTPNVSYQRGIGEAGDPKRMAGSDPRRFLSFSITIAVVTRVCQRFVDHFEVCLLP